MTSFYYYEFLDRNICFGDLYSATGTIPMELLLQLKSAFEPGGLKNRDGSVSYKELLKDCEVPVMAIAGDHDLICPTSAVIGESAISWNVLCHSLEFNGSQNDVF